MRNRGLLATLALGGALMADTVRSPDLIPRSGGLTVPKKDATLPDDNPHLHHDNEVSLEIFETVGMAASGTTASFSAANYLNELYAKRSLKFVIGKDPAAFQGTSAARNEELVMPKPSKALSTPEMLQKLKLFNEPKRNSVSLLDEKPQGRRQRQNSLFIGAPLFDQVPGFSGGDRIQQRDDHAQKAIRRFYLRRNRSRERR